jgi:hypothetical protein
MNTEQTLMPYTLMVNILWHWCIECVEYGLEVVCFASPFLPERALVTAIELNL